jgi:hypothetical protein
MFVFGLVSILMVYGAIDTKLSTQFVIYGAFVFVGSVSLIFVCDAFRRLRRCLEHDQVGISSKQIVVHLSIFTVSLIALTLYTSAMLTV